MLFRIRPSFLPTSPSTPPLISTDSAHTLTTVLEPRTNVHTSSTHTAHTFSSDGCFLASSSTSDLYSSHVDSLIPFVLCGGYATVLAYGQTGSGKTHTLSECSRLAIASLFRQNQAKCHVTLQAIEIYGKSKVNDLFDRTNTRVLIAENIAGSSTFAKATTKPIRSAESMLEEVESAWSQRMTRGTEKNPQSSRSHALIRIICQPNKDKNATPGVLQLVDLAGSERAADHSASGARACGGDVDSAQRMAETVAINTSLMTLKSCIRARTSPTPPAIGSGAAPVPHIPFRSSKLTLALKEAFDLYSRQPTHTLLIATASPDVVDVAATLNTLRYASALVAAPHARIQLQPDPQGRNVFFWSNQRLAEWLTKYASPLLTSEDAVQVLAGMDGSSFAKLPEGEFYSRIQAIIRTERWTNQQQTAAKEVYLKWWKLVIASRTLSQKALEQEWKQRQKEKATAEEHETREDKDVQRLLRLPSIAAAPTSA